MSKMNYKSIPGMDIALPEGLSTHLCDNMDEYRALVNDLPDEISKAHEMYEYQET